MAEFMLGQAYAPVFDLSRKESLGLHIRHKPDFFSKKNKKSSTKTQK
jgi:hypothetical protein